MTWRLFFASSFSDHCDGCSKLVITLSSSSGGRGQKFRPTAGVEPDHPEHAEEVPARERGSGPGRARRSTRGVRQPRCVDRELGSETVRSSSETTHSDVEDQPERDVVVHPEQRSARVEGRDHLPAPQLFGGGGAVAHVVGWRFACASDRRRSASDEPGSRQQEGGQPPRPAGARGERAKSLTGTLHWPSFGSTSRPRNARAAERASRKSAPSAVAAQQGGTTVARSDSFGLVAGARPAAWSASGTKMPRRGSGHLRGAEREQADIRPRALDGAEARAVAGTSSGAVSRSLMSRIERFFDLVALEHVLSELQRLRDRRPGPKGVRPRRHDIASRGGMSSRMIDLSSDGLSRGQQLVSDVREDDEADRMRRSSIRALQRLADPAGMVVVDRERRSSTTTPVVPLGEQAAVARVEVAGNRGRGPTAERPRPRREPGSIEVRRRAAPRGRRALATRDQRATKSR